MEYIKKISKLKNPESFIQLNTIKGFKYIDKAGEIMNLFHIDNKPPAKFLIDLNGMVIENPKQTIRMLKITPLVVWTKFDNVDLEVSKKSFTKYSKEILHVLDVSSLSRIGWRNYFIYENKSEKEHDEILRQLSPLDSKLLSTQLTLNTAEFKTNLIIEPVVKTDAKSSKGLLFDLDIFQEGTFGENQIEEVLDRFLGYINDSNGFLKVINDILKKGNENE